MPSFDIVSKIDMQEVNNAIANSMKEISQRYDFKGSNSKLEIKYLKQKISTLISNAVKIHYYLFNYKSLEIDCKLFE